MYHIKAQNIAFRNKLKINLWLVCCSNNLLESDLVLNVAQ